MTSFETLPQDWLSIPEALERILTAAEPLSQEEIPLEECVGRALAQDAFATATLPPWDNSAMDGYAVRYEDLVGAQPASPVVLRVIGEIRAGGAALGTLRRGEAVRIMTGAPVPQGADAIVRVEDTDAEKSTPGQVEILTSPSPGKAIRPGGQDMSEGEKLLGAGTCLGPGQIGLLAATGSTKVRVHRRPRVAVLSNGDEIAPVSEFHRVRSGEAIPETNGPTLSAAVRSAGGIPLPLGIARDTPESIIEKVNEARRRKADVLVTSGGASMGEHDLFKRVLDGIGFKLDFWRVKMRPGTPFSFGFLTDDEAPLLPVFGLPGNPASSFVTFQVLCRPFLLKIAGHGRIHRPVLLARAGETFRSPVHLTFFFRVKFRGDPASPEVMGTGSQTSGLVRGQGLAQGLAVVPEGVEEIREGETIRVILLDDFGLGGDRPGFIPE